MQRRGQCERRKRVPAVGVKKAWKPFMQFTSTRGIKDGCLADLAPMKHNSQAMMLEFCFSFKALLDISSNLMCTVKEHKGWRAGGRRRGCSILDLSSYHPQGMPQGGVNASHTSSVQCFLVLYCNAANQKMSIIPFMLSSVGPVNLPSCTSSPFRTLLRDTCLVEAPVWKREIQSFDLFQQNQPIRVPQPTMHDLLEWSYKVLGKRIVPSALAQGLVLNSCSTNAGEMHSSPVL